MLPDQQRLLEFLARAVKKPCGRSLTLGATARNESAEACEVILITDAVSDVGAASAPRCGEVMRVRPD